MTEIVWEYANEQEDIAVSDALLQTMQTAALSVLQNEKLEGTFEISLTLVDAAQIQRLNAAYRAIDKVTDVLSFPMGEGGDYPENRDTGAKVLGDIVICASRAAEQAREYGHSLERECGFLCAHSTLHLLGYDHVDSAEQAAQMEQKQEAALRKIGLSR